MPLTSLAFISLSSLRHIVRTLQQESQSATQRNKLLESENRLLVTETDQLRQVLLVLQFACRRLRLLLGTEIIGGQHRTKSPAGRRSTERRRHQTLQPRYYVIAESIKGAKSQI